LQKKAAPKKELGPLANLLDEIGHENTKSKHNCPECQVNLPTDAVLCVQCGYHLAKGKRLTTKRITRGA
jgi:ribosomal protein L40E